MHSGDKTISYFFRDTFLKRWFIITVEINPCTQKNVTNQRWATENCLIINWHKVSMRSNHLGKYGKRSLFDYSKTEALILRYIQA